MKKEAATISIDAQGKELYAQPPRIGGLRGEETDVNTFAASFIAPHWHREFELFWLLRGKVRVEAAGVIHTLSGGQACFLGSEALHSMQGFGSSCPYRNFIFSPGIVGGEPGSTFATKYVWPLLEKGQPFVKFTPEDDPEFFRYFGRAFHAWETEEPGYEFTVRYGLSQILRLVGEKCLSGPVKQTAAREGERIKQMIAWIDENYGNAVTAGQIAEAAGICVRTAQRLFRRYLHCGPIDFLLRRRVLASAELLAGTDLPVTEIALRCGFSSPGYYTRQFKSIMRLTPREYRAKGRES